MFSSPIDEEKTTSSRSRRKISKDPEMSRCFPKSEITMHSLSQNAATFLNLFYSKEIWMTFLVQRCLDLCKYLTFQQEFIRILMLLGLMNVILLCGIVSSNTQGDNVLKTRLICLLPITPVVAFKHWFKRYKNLKEINLNMQEFRRIIFRMAVELGKLKQRCEDLKGSLRPGLEKGNLKRLERDIVILLDTMEELEDTATLQTIGRVEADYRFLFSRLEMMTVSLCFYKSDYENYET